MPRTPYLVEVCTVKDCDAERVTRNNKYCPMHNWRFKRYGDPLHKRPGTRGPGIPPEKRAAIHDWIRAVEELGRAHDLAKRLGLEVHTVEVYVNRYRHRARPRTSDGTEPE